MKSVLFIGDGAWGTALGIVLNEKGFSVRIWGAFPDYVAETRRKRENARFLPGVKIPDTIALMDDAREASQGIDLVVVSTPTQFIRPVLKRFAGMIPPSTPVVSIAKGIETRTLLRPSQIVKEVLASRRVGVLSGPSHAEEVAGGAPTVVTASSTHRQFAQQIQQVFMTSRLRIYTNTDIVGVELGAALKNIIAIAAGISDGLGFGDNTKAAIVTRGLAEITRLGRAMGARASTFWGLSGIGDLFVTCTSRHSRNRWCGEQIGGGKTLAEVLASTQKVVEGVATTSAALRVGSQHGVELPITSEVYRVLFRGKQPARAVKDLMTRRAKSEETRSPS